MRDLWGNEIPQEPQKKTPAPPLQNLVVSTSQDCYFYGHSWTAAGLSGEKLCTVCGIKGYCPCCTPKPASKEAKPFLCTKHSQGRVQA